ncbi:hypothetical protein EYF80_062605 [Liparis tanakae]|uniref:Uncharacterized protein n=1 Tax=Liparis tanakae TaxID=230148 RepID=A0A4Z2EG13_9TELE|nr:hypothetical protein EYF80_062605 [Liparis tanakae]
MKTLAATTISLYVVSLYDVSLYEVSLYDVSLYDVSLYDHDVSDSSSHFQIQDTRHHLFDCVSLDVAWREESLTTGGALEQRRERERGGNVSRSATRLFSRRRVHAARLTLPPPGWCFMLSVEPTFDLTCFRSGMGAPAAARGAGGRLLSEPGDLGVERTTATFFTLLASAAALADSAWLAGDFGLLWPLPSGGGVRGFKQVTSFIYKDEEREESLTRDRITGSALWSYLTSSMILKPD